MTRDTYCKDVIVLFRIMPIKFNDKFEKNASFYISLSTGM